MKRILIAVIALMTVCWQHNANACTGITLHAADGATIPARTIEWAGNDLESCYAVVPRGYQQQSFLPDGSKGGMTFTADYGYVGLAVQQADFVVEGVNEQGLSAGLFYFPAYGEYETFDETKKSSTISDLQLVSWILGRCKSVDEVKDAIRGVHVVTIDPRGSTVHWRFTERSGRQIVLEIVGKEPRFYENTLGVLTNAPGFEWQLTNLNNYVNLYSGPVAPRQVGTMQLSPFGGGGGLHGIPGDMTPPSRFVRAAFYQATAPQMATSEKAVTQAFHILNNFDIPTGIQFANGQPVPDIPSATQWTVATDLRQLCIYYRTMHDATIRCFDLKAIDFQKIGYFSAPLDEKKEQPIKMMSLPKKQKK